MNPCDFHEPTQFREININEWNSMYFAKNDPQRVLLNTLFVSSFVPEPQKFFTYFNLFFYFYFMMLIRLHNMYSDYLIHCKHRVNYSTQGREAETCAGGRGVGNGDDTAPLELGTPVLSHPTTYCIPIAHIQNDRHDIGARQANRT